VVSKSINLYCIASLQVSTFLRIVLVFYKETGINASLLAAQNSSVQCLNILVVVSVTEECPTSRV